MRIIEKKQKLSLHIKSDDSKKRCRSFSGKKHVVHSIQHLQHTIGNEAVQRLVKYKTENFEGSSEQDLVTGFAHDQKQLLRKKNGQRNIKPKLKVNAPGDKYEQEADRVAELVLRRETPDEREQLNAEIQTNGAGGDRDIAEDMQIRLDSSRGGGSSLSPATRTFFESSMLHDFSKVRIHTDKESARINEKLGAHAFTLGRDIFFGANQYNPQSVVGRRLIAHELTHVMQQSGGHSAGVVHRARGLIQRNVVTFEEGTTIVTQPLGPHLYNEIESGLTVEPAPGISIGYWYRIYEVRPGVDINQLYNDLETLYGYGRFLNLSPRLAAYLGTRIAPRISRFFALYPNRRFREPIDITRLRDLQLGIVQPREVAQPGITEGFTERRGEAWTALAPTARIYINDWADWSLRGLDRLLEGIPMEENRSVQNALSIFGNVLWALTAFIPAIGPITRAVAGGVSLVGSLTAGFASITPGTDVSTARKLAIRDVQEAEITRVADGLEQRDRLAPILITVLVKAQERGIAVSERDALLWNHMFDIPYTTTDSGRRARIRQRAYSALNRSWGGRIR